MKTATQIRAEGEALTPEAVALIAAKFREEIGGVYEVIAARIELDHVDRSGGDLS